MYTAQVPTDSTAVMGRRFGAFIVNFVIFAVVVFIGSRTIADFKSEDIPLALQDDDVCELLRQSNSVSMCFSSDDTVVYATGSNAALGVFVLPLAVTFANSVLLAAFAGGSIGKLLFGLRVVNKDTGAVAGFGKSIIRWILWAVDAFPYCLPLVGLITGLSTKGHRRVGDMAAGTLVVNKASVGTPPMHADSAATAPPMGWSPPPGGFGPPAAPGGYGAPPAPGQWAPPAPPADPWSQPAPPPADPWSQPVAPPAPTWNDPIPPAAAPPAPEPQPVVEPAASDPAAGGPQWDAARNAYIQYEPVAGQWMQFDDAAQEWRPLS